MQWHKWLAMLLLAGILSACAGTGTQSSRKSSPEDAQRAARIQVQLGQGYMQQGRLEIALDRLENAVRLDPYSVDAHTMLAVLHERIRRPQKAEKFYRKAVSLAPENGEVNNNLGAFLCGSGRYLEARPYFLKALDDPFYASPDAARINAGLCARQNGALEQAEVWFRQVLDSQPDNPTALYEMARLNLDQNQAMRARAFLQRLESIQPDAASTLDLGRNIETRFGNEAAARQYAQRLKDAFPDYEPVDLTSGTSSP